LGLELQLLGREHYVEAKLEPLTSKQLTSIRNTFVKNAHPSFKKEFASNRHQPSGKTADYVIALGKADSAKIAKLIKIMGNVAADESLSILEGA